MRQQKQDKRCGLKTNLPLYKRRSVRATSSTRIVTMRALSSIQLHSSLSGVRCTSGTSSVDTPRASWSLASCGRYSKHSTFFRHVSPAHSLKGLAGKGLVTPMDDADTPRRIHDARLGSPGTCCMLTTSSVELDICKSMK